MTRLSLAALVVCVLVFAAPAAAQTPLARLDADRITLLSPITFEHGTATLTPEGVRVADAVAQILRGSPGLRIEIGVHTDSRGTEEYNLRVTQERADALRAYLVAHGVGGGRLVATGYGESQPIDSNTTAEGREHNQRVELLLRRDPSGAARGS